MLYFTAIQELHLKHTGQGIMNSTVMPAQEKPEGRHSRLLEARAAVNAILLGKDHQVSLAFCCLLSRGHVLIEDVPGVGKTTLAHALARVIGTDYQRIQFTSDLLPADILGVSIYKREQDRTASRADFFAGHTGRRSEPRNAQNPECAA
jgi:MoxR-like ATPase